MRPFANTAARSSEGRVVRRDLYAEVSARIVAELEVDQAMVSNGRRKHAMQRREQ